jgi:site-specific DNA-methyltransferase (adenine-specific)
MSVAEYLIGDVFDVLASMPDASVDLVLTSPPFLALRSYLPADHPDKHKEIGSEPTPAEFLDTLLALTAEWGRVLAPHGSICVELGDTYAGNNGFSAMPYENKVKNWAEFRVDDKGKQGDGWPLDKSLCGIPHLYHLSLAYGRNLLTGETSPAGQWRVRNVVAWCRPNPPVGALGDKFRPATSYMTIACRARDRWFDLDAVRHQNDRSDEQTTANDKGGVRGPQQSPQNSAGAPPLDWWNVSTEPYSGSHYATWPRKLLDRPIKAMCPMQVCVECGQPRRRLTETTRVRTSDGTVNPPRVAPTRDDAESGTTAIGVRHAVESRVETIGWSDCGHDNYRNGVVLDPFAGSGTTLAVATGHGRDAIGIDLDARNADLARERIGMFTHTQNQENER